MPRPVITSPQRKRRNDIIKFTPPYAASEHQLHSIVGDARLNTTLCGHGIEGFGKLALVLGDNFRAAMGDDGSWNALFCAPRQLRAHRCMSDKGCAACANERTR